MGAGGEEPEPEPEVPLAQQGVNHQALVAEETWVKPFFCDRCKEFLENGASQKYVDTHREGHRKADENAQMKIAARNAQREQKLNAAGPSARKKRNRQKDMRAEQRNGNGNGNGNNGNGNNRNGNGNGKGKKGKPPLNA